MSFSRNRRRWALLALCCAVGVVGCSPGASDVSGTIKLNGQAPKMKGLEIVFMAPDGRQASARIDPDGTYKATDVPAGEAKVYFAYAPEVATNKKGRLWKPEDKPKLTPTGKNPIPQRLQEASTSGITTPIAAGKPNVFDYDIK